MSKSGSTLGGIFALRGFDYQSTVILDRLFAHFDEHGPSASVRPEGEDDLVLSWTGNEGLNRRRFEQIKKPREDMDANRTGVPWTLTQVASELLPDTLARLDGNHDEQVWVLGDEIDEVAAHLVAAGRDAPGRAPEPYWRMVHALALGGALQAGVMDAPSRRRLGAWKPPSGPGPSSGTTLDRFLYGFRRHAEACGVRREVSAAYGTAAERIHLTLPNVLGRVRIEPLFGSEQQVADRVRRRLEERYGLPASVVEATLFRNLRGFINDIAKQPARRFDQEEFELELRTVWPQMSPIKKPLLLPADHVYRPALSVRFTSEWRGRAVEAIGVSGSGKTLLASEVLELSLETEPGRIVLYAEARQDMGLRDVLVGAAFHLRRLGKRHPFPAGVDGRVSADEAIETLARAFSVAATDVLLLVDLLQGSCSDAFARELAAFVGLLRPHGFRLAVLGQESAFRQMTPAERGRLDVSTVEIGGFNQDEFVRLASGRHPRPDHALLNEVFRRMTAGRRSGLYAKLARALSEAPSLAAMREMAKRPADELLQLAEQRKFARVSEGARAAAAKLVCFALPFGRDEAAKAFPDDNVGEAIREMTQLGLLRPSGDGDFEMHETVRAGLETTMTARQRTGAHELLAAHYARLGDVTAEVFHLERAGRQAEARERARRRFLQGERWAALADFVCANSLVTPAEVLGVFARINRIDGAYLLPDVLARVGELASAALVLDVARGQPQRFVGDFQWGQALAVACLRIDPECLHGLVRFVLAIDRDPQGIEGGIGIVGIACRRCGCDVDGATLAFFASSGPDVKRLLLPILIATGKRRGLGPALAFMAVDPVETRSGQGRQHPADQFLVAGPEQAMELLAALPDRPDHEMVALRSPLLGPLVHLVWRNRQRLRACCVAVLEGDGHDAGVQRAAIRVLAVTGESRLHDLCATLAERGSEQVRSLAAIAPSMAPLLLDCPSYEARVLNTGNNMEGRLAALAVLASVPSDLGALHDRLRRTETDLPRLRVLEYAVLQLACDAPFAGAVPLIEAHLRSPDSEGPGVLFGPLACIGRLPNAAVGSALLRAAAHPNRSMRAAAVLALGRRRSTSNLPRLRELLAAEGDPIVSAALATAVLASGARSVAAMQDAACSSPVLDYWRCVLAARTRDVTFAPQLVALALDRGAPWHTRRAAIQAAGSLPFEAALERLLPILEERSPLEADDPTSLWMHALLGALLLHDPAFLVSAFREGRAPFVELVSGFLRHGGEPPIGAGPMPAVSVSAEWLFEALAESGAPADPNAPVALLNRLHIPLLHSAILRAMRYAGRADLLEAHLAEADHLWVGTKCLLECARANRPGVEVAERLRRAVARSPLANEPLLQRIIEEQAAPHAAGQPSAQPPPQSKPESVKLDFADAVGWLTNRRAGPHVPDGAVIVMATLTAEQFDHLVRLADPIYDFYAGAAERHLPEMRLLDGGHTVASRQLTVQGGSPTAGQRLRPAIAAVNVAGVGLPWHEEALAGPYPEAYSLQLLACLSARGDAGDFYRALSRDADFLVPHLCLHGILSIPLPLIDDRIVPFLEALCNAGTDETLAGLCGLAGHVVTSSIDRVLRVLFRRWAGRFGERRAFGHTETGHHVWRAFASLAEHPRFHLVEGWEDLMMQVLQFPLSWWNRQTITRVLERSPRSYVQLETMLSREEDWSHFYEDEIGRLQRSVGNLFRQTSP